jgi:hypothetical protein
MAILAGGAFFAVEFTQFLKSESTDYVVTLHTDRTDSPTFVKNEKG